MVDRIEIDSTEIVVMAEAFQNAPAIIMDEIIAATVQSTLLAERETRERTPVGVGGDGGLRGSIAAQEPRVLGNEVIGETGSPLNYVIPVELGTRPHFPPVSALHDWVRIKLGVPDDDVEEVAFKVARKIAAHGTEGAHMFARMFAANEPQFAAIYRGARDRIVQRMAEEGRT